MTTSLALTELTRRVQQLSREELLALGAQELAEIDWMLEDQRCAESVASFEAGPLYFLTRLAKTENPQCESQGVPFKAPFPKKTYFVFLFDAFLRRFPMLFIPKSRTLMTSWAAMGFAFWAAQWHQEETIVQTASEEKAFHLVDYARQLFDNQEPWLKQRHPLKRCSSFALGWEAGGEVAVIASGADKIRMYHPSNYIMDEAAYLPEGEECLNAVIPTGARIIAISSARAGWFGDQCGR
jgi:hypothetical protein